MLLTRVLESLALLAAVMAGSNASPISFLQARTSIAEGSLLPSNCAAMNVTDGFCDFQYLSYEGFEVTGLDPTKACDAFNEKCASYAVDGKYATTVVTHCTPDRANKVITASCVMRDCEQKKAFSYTGVVASQVPSHYEGLNVFYPTEKCPNGEGFCPPKVDLSRTTPLQFNDPGNETIDEVCSYL